MPVISVSVFMFSSCDNAAFLPMGGGLCPHKKKKTFDSRKNKTKLWKSEA